jgi:hypothetical protein
MGLADREEQEATLVKYLQSYKFQSLEEFRDSIEAFSLVLHPTVESMISLHKSPPKLKHRHKLTLIQTERIKTSELVYNKHFKKPSYELH